MKKENIRALLMVFIVGIIGSGCAGSPIAHLINPLEHKQMDREYASYWNIRPSWVENPDPDSAHALYCYKEIPNARIYVQNNVLRYSSVSKYGFEQTYGYNEPGAKERVIEAVYDCLNTKYGLTERLALRESRHFFNAVESTSQYWFDGSYVYMKVILNIKFINDAYPRARKLASERFARYLSKVNSMTHKERDDFFKKLGCPNPSCWYKDKDGFFDNMREWRGQKTRW